VAASEVLPRRRYRVIVCRGPECGERRGSAALSECFRREALRLGGEIEHHFELGHQACFGRCRQGPNVLVRPAPTAPAKHLLATPAVRAGDGAALYGGVEETDVVKILQSHVGRGIIVRELVRRPDEVLEPKGRAHEHDDAAHPSRPPTPPFLPLTRKESGER
jgi:(2Fe-2S) ferredoxin